MITQPKEQNKRYLPHEVTARINAVKLYRQTRDIGFVVRRYHISKASLMRWNKQYDGTKESLMDKSHRSHSQHPNAHTDVGLELGIVHPEAAGAGIRPGLDQHQPMDILLFRTMLL